MHAIANKRGSSIVVSDKTSEAWTNYETQELSSQIAQEAFKRTGGKLVPLGKLSSRKVLADLSSKFESTVFTYMEDDLAFAAKMAGYEDGDCFADNEGHLLIKFSPTTISWTSRRED